MTPSERNELIADVLDHVQAAVREASDNAKGMTGYAFHLLDRALEQTANRVLDRIPPRDEPGEDAIDRYNAEVDAYNAEIADEDYAAGKRAGRLEGLREALGIANRRRDVGVYGVYALDIFEEIEAAICRAEEAESDGE